MKKFFIGIMLFVLPAFCFGQYKLYPRNEVYKDSSLTDFICKMQYAVYKLESNWLQDVSFQKKRKMEDHLSDFRRLKTVNITRLKAKVKSI